ncbi:ankyrin repeat protein [Xylaria sp. CBS 124048]|nr:ankyrin repeat protein [Xylaria sp. CBS 124048]
MSSAQLPKLPVAHHELVDYIAQNPDVPLNELLDPYRKFEAKLRELYAQDPANVMLQDQYLNALPLFTRDTPSIRTRARNLEVETQDEKDKYIMPLTDDKRRPDGSPAVVGSLKEFQYNFGIFSESSLSDMDWNNVIVAGSAVVNTLLPVPPGYKKSKRTMRQYYHEIFCPASDVDLFLYGLTEEQAIQKIKDIETYIKGALLTEVTVVRTKNAITFCSKYPTRHVQIVLRLYKSISEILSGFDIDCSCAAYDGNQVYVTPRALASYISQINPIDLSRRSPSYENRLSKYSHRDFEIHWPELDRSRVDPTIYERRFQRTLGLARLLVLERLPTNGARQNYLEKRREEQGRRRPAQTFHHRLFGNIKDIHEDEVADWVQEDEVSNYHTFTLPYGEKFHARKIEKLCYTKDLLLNAEWNQPKDREVYLHRHPAFFGTVEDVLGDCCGTCPKPHTREEIETAKFENEIYVAGNATFRIDDPGRQAIGSFNPLTDDDWTEMAYVGNTARLCQAIIDEDFEHVEDWLSQEGADPNRRDYTGRTPLHLAVISSTPEIVKLLVDHGARLVSRIADGRTALHLAAERGSIEMIRILLEKSNANEEEEAERQDQRRKAGKNTREDSEKHGKSNKIDVPMKHVEDQHNSDESDESDEDAEFIDDSSDDGSQSVATGSFVKVRNKHEPELLGTALFEDDDQNDPDIYKIDVVTWESKCSAVHLAILGGHCEVVKLLCQEFGADPLLPVKTGGRPYGAGSAESVILTLTLALALPDEKAARMCETLLSLGATSSQADAHTVTAFHRCIQSGGEEVIRTLCDNDKLGLKNVINHIVATDGWPQITTSPLMSAIVRGNPDLVRTLLEAGAKPEIDFDNWLEGAKASGLSLYNFDYNHNRFEDMTEQPLVLAIRSPHPLTALDLLERGVDPNTVTRDSRHLTRHDAMRRQHAGETALDLVRSLLDHLRQYDGTPDDNNREPRGTAEFLSQFPGGTYRHWIISADIDEKMEHYQRASSANANKPNGLDPSLKGSTEKMEAIRDAISQLEIVENALLEKGAKTFAELYHKDSLPQPQNQPISQADRSYTFELGFPDVRDLTLDRKEGYVELFEAAWTGDLDKIKSLTLGPWGHDAKQPPLKIAVRDVKGNNPFSLAFFRGHLSTAKAILEIAQAQWSPREQVKVRFLMVRPDMNEAEFDVGENDGKPEIYKEIVNDQFTIENIGQVSMQVRSDVLPSTLMNWKAPTFKTNGEKVEKNYFYNSRNPFIFAMDENDRQGFLFLLELWTYFGSGMPEDAGADMSAKVYTVPGFDIEHVFFVERVNLLPDAIRLTGAGLPLEILVKKGEQAAKVQPRYYQGLTVYGKKRADWAKKAEHVGRVRRTKSDDPPLLIAALNGSLESVKWCLSDEPARCYSEFGKSRIAREDPRLKLLDESPGGFDRAIASWLGIQNDLVIHCAVLGPFDEETYRLIEYLTKVCPSSLEARSDMGYTPLYLACLMGRVDFAKTLIKAGADQSVQDPNLNNVLHACLANFPKVELLRQMLDLFDPELRAYMFRQRNNLKNGGDTPLHAWIKSFHVLSYTTPSHPEHPESLKILRLLLEASGGEELGMFNACGDTVLHTAALRSLPEHARVLIERSPGLLYGENAVGRTPAEYAYATFVNHKLATPMPIEFDSKSSFVRGLTQRKPETFTSPSAEEKSREAVTWDLFQEYLARNPGKRRLVSLNEANNVVRRLTESTVPMRPAQAVEYWDQQENQQENQQEGDTADCVSRIYAKIRSSDAWKS